MEKISSLELRTKLFEEPNIQFAAAIDNARAWETARRQASSIAEGEGGQSNVNVIKNCDSKKPSIGFGTHKCYACGKVGHFARDKICPGKRCAKCGNRGHGAACCRSETASKKSGREGGRGSDGRASGNKQRHSRDTKHDLKSGNRQVNQVQCDSGDEAFAFPIIFSGEPVRIMW